MYDAATHAVAKIQGVAGLEWWSTDCPLSDGYKGGSNSPPGIFFFGSKGHGAGEGWLNLPIFLSLNFELQGSAF